MALTARSVEELDEVAADIEEAGGQALVAPGDVTDRLAVEAILARVEGGLGPIDLLVNGVGAGADGEGGFIATEPDDWWRQVEAELRGTALCSQLVLRRMAPRLHGRIVNVVGDQGREPPPGLSARHTADAGVLRLTEALAREGRESGVQAFAIKREPFLGAAHEDGPAAAARTLADIAGGRTDGLSGRLIDPAGALQAREPTVQPLAGSAPQPQVESDPGAWRPPAGIGAQA